MQTISTGTYGRRIQGGRGLKTGQVYRTQNVCAECSPVSSSHKVTAAEVADGTGYWAELRNGFANVLA